MKAKLWHLNSLLYVALLLALLSSLGHVAYAFTTVNGANWTEAYISAVAIDIGLLALAAGINQRKGQRRPTRWLWAGVIFFSAISTYANWLAGLAHVKPFETELGRFAAWLVTLRPILLSAVLPILVIYLSEIVSGNYHVDQEQARKEARKQAKKTETSANEPFVPGDLAALERANETRQANVSQRREQVLTLHRAGVDRETIAGELGVSLSTVKRDLRSLNGRSGGEL